MTIIYISLSIALMFLFSSITPGVKRYKKVLMITGIIFYLIFILASVTYKIVNRSEERLFVINKTNIKLNTAVGHKNEGNAPISLEWQTESLELKKGVVFNLKLRITNNTESNIDSFKLNFPEKKLQDQFSISQVNPLVNIDEKRIIFGKVKKGESVEFVFELVPKTTGLFKAKVEPLGDDNKPIINKYTYLKPLEIRIIDN